MNAATPGTSPRREQLSDGVTVLRAFRPAGAEVRPHSHPAHMIAVLLSSPGASEWRFGEVSRRCRRPAAGEVFVCPAGVEVSVRCERPFEFIALGLSPARLDGVAAAAPGLPAGGVRPAVLRHDPFVRHVVLTLAEEAWRAGGGRELLAASLATALGVHLLREYAAAEGAGERVPGLTGDELARLQRHVDGRLDADLSLDRLAAVIHKSRSHFARLFKASTGLTPHQYVVRRRVERARDLLRAGGAIAQVAAAVGFASQSHLCHHVRRAFGCTPGELADPRRAERS